MAKIRSLVGIALALSLGAPGCGGSADAQKKRVRELEEELTRLQNSHDRLEERLTSLELSRPPAQAGPKPSAEAKPGTPARPEAEPAPGTEERALAATIERPPLKVFKLAPPGAAPGAGEAPEAEASDEAADEPRPVIRGQGQRIEHALPVKKPGAPKAKR